MLQMSYVVYAVGRWRGFQEMGYGVMGAINNTALLVGTSIIDPACEKTKQLAWRVYRYLTVAHILGYRQHAPSRWFQEMTMQDLIECGLLTREEAAAIEPAQNTMHELLCSWVSAEMFEGCEKGLLSKQLIVVMPTNIRGIRIVWVWVGVGRGLRIEGGEWTETGTRRDRARAKL